MAGYGGLYDTVKTCTKCGADTWKAAGRGACEKCPDNSRSVEGSDKKRDCKCVDGFERDANDNCRACRTGLYMIPSSKVCTPCPAKTYTDSPAATECTSCPRGTQSESGSNELIDCICKAGRTASSNGVECSACGVGKYKGKTGALECSSCPSGSTSAARSGACSPCPVGTSSAAGSTAIAACSSCAPGYTKVGTTCKLCPEGTFKTDAGTQSCSKCPDNTGSAAGSTQMKACTCVPGHTARENGVDCEACPVGMSNSKGGTHSCTKCDANTESTIGSATCQCSAGFTRNEGGRCTVCEAGSYNDKTGSKECSACPWFTSSAAGSKEQSDCKCLAGYTAASDGVECTACDEGTFKGATGSGECRDCLAGTYTATKGSGTCAACP
ncbi:hypothetical protein T484DRAFT_1643042, partial [Baffinella frigidus]